MQISKWQMLGLVVLLCVVSGMDSFLSRTPLSFAANTASDLRSTQQSAGGPHSRFSLPMGLSIQAFASVNQQIVLAGTFGQGVYRSENAGKSWRSSRDGLTDQFILSLIVDPKGTVYAGTFRSGVFRSDDQGKTWTEFSDGLKGLQIKALLFAKNTLYAGTGDGVYQFHQGKKQWIELSKDFDNLLVHSLTMASNGTLYAGTSGKGILQLKPNAKGWTRLSEGLVDHEGMGENFIRVLAIDQDHRLYSGTFDGGVFLSSDKGRTWRPISRALPNDSIRGIVTQQDRLFVATGRGIFQSQNRGKAWMPVNEGLTERSIQVLFGDAHGVLFAGTSGGAFRSVDHGTTWVAINEGMEGTLHSPFEGFKGKE